MRTAYVSDQKTIQKICYHSPLTNAIFDLGALAALGAAALLLAETLGAEGTGRLVSMRPDPAMD